MRHRHRFQRGRDGYRRLRTALSLLALSAVAGCVAYRPQPITPAAVKRALRPPTTAEARQRLALSDDPLLRADVALLDADPAAGLTPDTAGVRAVATHPLLRAARNDVRAADAKRVQAGLLPDPELAFSLDVPTGANTSGEVVGYGLTLDWEITALIPLDANRRAADEAAKQSRLDVAWQEWQIAEAAKQAVYDVIAQQEQRTLADALAGRLDAIAGRFHQALDRGDVGQAEVAAIDAAAGEARVTAAAARRDLADAEVSLRRALGVAADADVPIDPRTTLPDGGDVPDAARFLEHLTDQRIDLVALRRGYASQEEALRAAVLGQFPKIRFGLANSRDTGNFLDFGPAFGVTLPVFDWNQGNIAVAQATRQQLFDEYVARVFEARSDVTRAVSEIRAVGDQISVMDGQVKTLQTLLDADERALNEGNIDVTAFYTAAVSLAQRQADRLKLQQDLVHARIALELAAGVRLPTTGTAR